MDALLGWLVRHWVSAMIAAALIVACVFVLVNRKALFYKE
ncbi:hypothetical protein B8V81_1890 [Paenibacillus pasadenensis]|uniref:Uncharacterized protein n=1 Tax=Paenibacillus pasadenensis TaxID=217090 RepID=A0A2N5NBD7_9BACL|nr:hypothetical protein B8V81_1890 [Paenibacillus pasadenensis]